MAKVLCCTLRFVLQSAVYEKLILGGQQNVTAFLDKYSRSITSRGSGPERLSRTPPLKQSHKNRLLPLHNQVGMLELGLNG